MRTVLFVPAVRFGFVFFFFFNDTATTEIYTLSLHDALPISCCDAPARGRRRLGRARGDRARQDRKSTRLNSSHLVISYAVFCLKKKKRRVRAPDPGSSRRDCPARSSVVYLPSWQHTRLRSLT